MGLKNLTTFFFLLHLLLTFVLGAFCRPGFQADDTVPFHVHYSNLLQPPKELHLEGLKGDGFWKRRDHETSRRLMIGSTAPTCTYNECRGCRFKCKAEQVPVDANDPANSAYHYRCVCHR
ncbi:EPIDERMAL PATTERNING FACTOR-like protein 9 [Cocos nucifera]|uniref:EPIDERMAL PATTERNING FACTOR-like protein 9 n=1 Tax=Cocos nucifera TaxID=13894 RepID=A0A8K0I0X3_COCNU|nr:EPIDERMAL PATTERNING FACTOR-like protein 9 [Cocos nucifera]